MDGRRGYKEDRIGRKVWKQGKAIRGWRKGEPIGERERGMGER